LSHCGGTPARNSDFIVNIRSTVRIAPFTDPVSGEEHDVEVHLAKGFLWRVAQAAKTAVMKILTPNLHFDHSGKNAFYSVVEYQGP
jgi:hypothetical protein